MRFPARQSTSRYAMLQPLFMLQFLLALFAAVRALVQTRTDAALEILALRQQVAILKRKRPRPPLNACDRLFWTTLRRFWPRWSDVLLIVKPETVIGWHRAGLRLYWRWRSRARGGRPRITPELRDLIVRLADENPDWGAPKIHGELHKLGFTIAERTVARYLRRILRRGDPERKWLAFLQNHREVIAAMDFFTVPTVTFRVLYCFFVIEHSRRKILHFNATEHPTSAWIAQQIREAFPEDAAPRYLILDRDRNYAGEATEMLKNLGSQLIRTGFQSPWQNGIAERWVGSCRHELLDYVTVLNENHLRRLVRDYIRFYHEDRIHDSLDKDTLERRAIEPRRVTGSEVVVIPRLGGL